MCEVSDPIPTAIFGIFPTCFAIWLGIVGVWLAECGGIVGFWFGLQDVGFWFLVFILPDAGWLVGVGDSGSFVGILWLLVGGFFGLG